MRAKSLFNANAGILLFVAYSIRAAARDCAGEPTRGTPEEQGDAQMLFVEANNRFTIDLYLQLALDHKGENIFASPYSVSSVLMMAAEGARGETAAQMGKALRFPSNLRLGNDTDPIP